MTGAGSSFPERTVRLALIGGNIWQSRSPDLHRLCGRLTGFDVVYDLLVPDELGQEFEIVFETCARSGMRGVNVTYPYKERLAGRIECGPIVARIGAMNTVVFHDGRPVGFNTDHTGFIAAYRKRFGAIPPGRVTVIGAGGVGRAIAFALVRLGASELSLIDRSQEKAEALAKALSGLDADITVRVASDLAEALRDADGIVNGTPVGMTGHSGSPVARRLLGPQRWAFDAVYTPVDTVFTRMAAAAGLTVLSGYALFLHQGVEAFELFTGARPVDLDLLERHLEAGRAP